MFAIILGVLDIIAALSLFLLKFSLAPWFAAIFAIYLLIKAVIFFRDFASIIDIFVVIIFVNALLGSFNILSWLAIIWLLQKGILSLFSF